LLPSLGKAARFVAESANLAFDEHAPYVGASAFAHKGGVHVAAIRRSARSYEHVDPALVGNTTRVVVSELSGRGNVLAAAEQHDVEMAAGVETKVLAQLKEQEAQGFSFEGAESSVALMLRRADAAYVAPFELVDYKVFADARASAEAAIKVKVRGIVHHTAAEGIGPVGALDAALRKALSVVYPGIRDIHLLDYKVRILDGRDGTSATTRVLTEHGDGVTSWTTVGASPSIIEASLRAIVDGIEHGLHLAAERRDQSSTDTSTKEGDSDEGHDRALAG